MCERRGWEISRFLQLPAEEQNAYLALEYQRRAEINNTISRILTMDEKPMAEVVTARVLLEVLQHL